MFKNNTNIFLSNTKKLIDNGWGWQSELKKIGQDALNKDKKNNILKVNKILKFK